ncbi:quercetin 2,3-dioxygenase [Roseicyclus sp. F158]|uniref:Quercetin 2,3-dioxygenase n=1 Tax=Tropicimonas omnivorans TaxID=3075590 RepID=A0ABU3DHI5_9RHOB|nr:quercetin 2,3-dioxygenase [Roseicyclus sp. F158]MDT0683185.1 quercetin 2,3-dioxygenase [Roseicyclus sp. F158]
MTLSRRSFFRRAALGGAAAALTGDIVMADAPLGQIPTAQADGTLPGAHELYALRDGEGEFRLIGGHVATVISRPEDTDGDCAAAVLTGSMDAGLPLHRHDETDEALYVMDGRLELHLDGKAHLLTAGDYAYVPAGTAHGYRMKSWRTRILTWSIGSGLGGFYEALGTPFSRPVQPDLPDLTIPQPRLDAAAAASDVTWLGALPEAEAAIVTAREIPEEKRPYVLMGGEGERLVAADQLFSLLQTSASTEGAFFAVLTEGPAGQPIPWHYHKHHTENFFCLEGRMTLWVNGEEMTLYPGDYCQVTPGTVHSYRLDTPYTKFFGWLVPAVFEPFFRTIGDPTEMHVFPMEPPAFRFDRVMARMDELDLNILLVQD